MGLSAWLNWEGAAIFQDFFLSKFCRFPRGLRDGKLQSRLGSSQVFQPCQRKSSMKDKPLIKLLLFSSIHTELFFFFLKSLIFFLFLFLIQSFGISHLLNWQGSATGGLRFFLEPLLASAQLAAALQVSFRSDLLPNNSVLAVTTSKP